MLSLNPKPLGALSRLPNEVLQNIAFLNVAAHPLGPPALTSLLLVNRALHDILDTDALKARIFRLSWDYGAVNRRSFQPYDQGLAEQLIQNCTLLKAIQRGDLQSPDTPGHLYTAYMLMLDNDGKNYAQLEWAGIEVFVDRFIRSHLFDGRKANEGWPLDTMANSCALWLAWMTIKQTTLEQEDVYLREQFIQLVLPFVLLTHRYPNAEAPPNHFHLPLIPSSVSLNPGHPLTTSSPSGPPYPLYISPNRRFSQVHFGARPDMSPPLASSAAKLLFVSRREISPIRIPPHPPVGLTIQDYHELNRGKTAELPRGARWDWDAGFARCVNFVNGQAHIIGEGDEESRKWDTEWWRRRLCWDIMAPRPKFTPGLLFTPGCMRGVWQGRFYMTDGNAFANLLHYYTAYPGSPHATVFTEASMTLAMIPVFFNIEEHHRICHCPLSAPCKCAVPTANDPDFNTQARMPSTGYPPASQYHYPDCHTFLSKPISENNGCGVIPVPLPLVVPRDAPDSTMADSNTADALAPAATAASSSVIAPPSSSSTSNQPSAPIASTSETSQGGTAIVGEHSPDHPDRHPEDDTASAFSDTQELEEQLPAFIHVDYSMKNAYFPGADIPSVRYRKRKVGHGRREEIVFTVQDGQNIVPVPIPNQPAIPPAQFPANHTAYHPGPAGAGASSSQRVPDIRFKGGICESLKATEQSSSKGKEKSASPPLAPSSSPYAPLSQQQFVYEKYDPDRRSSHNESKCLRCREWEDERRKQRAIAAEEVRRKLRGPEDAIKMLDQLMRDFGRRRMSDDSEDEEMDERIEDLDVSEFGSASESSAVSTSDEYDEEEENAPYDILGDDLPDGQPAVYDAQGNLIASATRRVFDKERVGTKEGCNGGIRDIVITGEVDPKHINWHRQQYTLYGRVRPFDGLVGFLRIDGRFGQPDSLNHMFVCGYVVAENTFVGEWRMAGNDPLRPAWSGPFVMSRRRGEQVPDVGGPAA